MKEGQTKPPEKRRKKRLESHRLAAFLFLSPALVFFAIFFVFPLVATVYLSGREWDLLGPALEAPGVGFRHYVEIWQDDRFVKALINTFLYVLACIAFMPPLALGVAWMLNEVKVVPWFWRLLFFLPVVTSSVAMSLVWQYIFDPTYGPLNEALKALGLRPLGWIMDPDLSLVSLIIVSLWQGIGYHAIIYLAGLQGIPDDYYEAATIDGAGAVRKFFHITLPLLKPTSLFVFVMVAINAFQAFTPFYVITNGGPIDSSNVLGLYIYKTAFDFLNMGKASAMAVVLFVLVVLVSVFQLRWFRRREEF
ncbi:MAG: hypothetical protein BAA02_14955 [Paenibacillaceae bacterium ZCTH02-B3]|nr:MAG: hypothetical protein BAA02_14955 [Paenibacillaceae bacterium ZCTH02-B3]